MQKPPVAARPAQRVAPRAEMPAQRVTEVAPTPRYVVGSGRVVPTARGYLPAGAPLDRRDFPDFDSTIAVLLRKGAAVRA